MRGNGLCPSFRRASNRASSNSRVVQRPAIIISSAMAGSSSRNRSPERRTAHFRASRRRSKPCMDVHPCWSRTYASGSGWPNNMASHTSSRSAYSAASSSLLSWAVIGGRPWRDVSPFPAWRLKKFFQRLTSERSVSRDEGVRNRMALSSPGRR